MYKSDGCTCWFNSNWRDCCDRHDKRYGSKRLNRKQADILLRRCVKRKSNALNAYVMFVGVRLFGWYFYKKVNYNE